MVYPSKTSHAKNKCKHDCPQFLTALLKHERNMRWGCMNHAARILRKGWLEECAALNPEAAKDYPIVPVGMEMDEDMLVYEILAVLDRLGCKLEALGRVNVW